MSLLGHFLSRNFIFFLENDDTKLRSCFCNVIYVKNVGWLFMNLAFNDSRIFSPMFTTVIKIGGNILESSETKLMNSPTYVFNVDHVAKMRSELSFTILDKKNWN